MGSQAFELSQSMPHQRIGVPSRRDRAETLANRSMARRRDLHLSQKELGDLCGVSQQSIHALEIGSVSHPRYLRELAIALRVRESWLLGIEGTDWAGAQENVHRTPGPAFETLPISGELRPGDWHDVSLPIEQQPAPSIITRDPRYPNAQQYVFRMTGGSMSRVYPDGTLILFAMAHEIDRELRSGDFVHVERLRDGQFIEHSCKEYFVAEDGSVSLRAHSDHHAFQETVFLRSEPDDTISITGLALGSFRPEPI